MVEALTKFYPGRYQESLTPEDRQEMEATLAEKWRGLSGKTSSDCVRILLTCTRKWQFFGATLFEVKVDIRGRSEADVTFTPPVQSEIDRSLAWLAINEEGVSVLEHNTMQVTDRFSYTNIITFGGCQDDFMLVISSPETAESQKLLFETSKPKILEITLLIADYMNMMGQILPLSHKSSTASSRVHSRSVSRSRLTSSTLTAINSAPNTPRLTAKDEMKSSLVRTGSTASYADKEQ